MYKIVMTLRALENPLGHLMLQHGNLHDRVKKLQFYLDNVQKMLNKDPLNGELRLEESVNVKSFNDDDLDEERFLK